ncbi:MAG TPA: hypothetical protein DCS93_18220 [Microscillaceae bacterium]|nr:hypothetical protein [Microscillaceae bacterium]
MTCTIIKATRKRAYILLFTLNYKLKNLQSFKMQFNKLPIGERNLLQNGLLTTEVRGVKF